MTTTWEDVALIMLRAMLNDISASVYSTSRLQQVLITSAYFLPMELRFQTSYIIDVVDRTITPEPLDQSDGQDFINFMVLKSVCMVDSANFRDAAKRQGVSAKAGPVSIDTSTSGQLLKELLTLGPCEQYETLKTQYNFSYESGGVLQAIMSPYTSNDFSPLWNSQRDNR